MSSFGFFGGGFGDFSAGFGQTDIGNINETAVLFLFKPHQDTIKDVSARPFLYQFDAGLVADVQELAHGAARGINENRLVEDIVQKNKFTDSVIPSHQPAFHLRTSQLTDFWRFILIFSESSTGLVSPGGNFVGNGQSVKRIYTGFFNDEPISQSFVAGRRAGYNEKARMTITHKTVVGTGRTVDQFGPRTINRSYASEQITHPNLVASLAAPSTGTGLNDMPLSLMTPQRCLSLIDVADDNSVVAVPGAALTLGNEGGVGQFSDVLEQPVHNVSQIMRGIVGANEEIMARRSLSTRSAGYDYDTDFLGESLKRRSIANNMEIPIRSSTSIFDLDVNRSITIADLDRMVGGTLAIRPADEQRPAMYDLANQSDVNMTNQYSSLISAVICPILAAAGLNQIDFTFQIAEMRNQVVPDWHVRRAAPSWPVSDNNELLRMVNAVKFELEKTLFETIFRSKGAFSVNVVADSTGFTTVQLFLVDQGIRNAGLFETPTFLGGTVSPLIGDEISMTSNSQQLEGLIGAAVGTTDVTGQLLPPGDFSLAFGEELPF